MKFRTILMMMSILIFALTWNIPIILAQDTISPGQVHKVGYADDDQDSVTVYSLRNDFDWMLFWNAVSAIVTAMFTMVIATAAVIFGRIRHTVKLDIGINTKAGTDPIFSIESMSIDITNIHQRPAIINEIVFYSNTLGNEFRIDPSRKIRLDNSTIDLPVKLRDSDTLYYPFDVVDLNLHILREGAERFPDQNELDFYKQVISELEIRVYTSTGKLFDTKLSKIAREKLLDELRSYKEN